MLITSAVPNMMCVSEPGFHEMSKWGNEYMNDWVSGFNVPAGLWSEDATKPTPY